MVYSQLDDILSESLMFNNIERIKLKKLNEDVKIEATKTLVSKLYESTLNKYRKLDYMDIKESKGIFTNFKNHDTIFNSIMLLKNLYNRSNIEIDDKNNLTIVENAIKNLEDRKNDFSSAYKVNNELLIMIYENIVVAIIICVSNLIASFVDYISTPNIKYKEQLTMNNKMDRNYPNVCFSSLEKFNNSCISGKMDKLFNALLSKQAFTFIGGTIGVGIVASLLVLTIIIAILEFIRGTIFFYYNSRVALAEYIKLQSEFLNLNVEKLIRQDGDPEVIKKQTYIINKLNALAEKIDVNNKVSNKNTNIELENNIKEIKTNNVNFGLV